MAEQFIGFETPPQAIILSGEGLRSMSLAHLNTLGRTLAGMDIKVIPVVEGTAADMAAYEPVDTGAITADQQEAADKQSEDDSEDIPVTKSDFYRYADELGFPARVVSLAWNAIADRHRRYTDAVDKMNKGEALDWFDQQVMSELGAWQLELWCEPGVLSFRGLQSNFLEGRLSRIYGVGPKSVEIYGGVIAAVVERQEKVTDQ